MSSDVLTLNDILKVYKSNRGVTPKIIQKGTIDDLEREALSERARIGPQNFWFVSWLSSIGSILIFVDLLGATLDYSISYMC